MTVIAEGVETFEELAYLQAATKIRYAQGYYFSKPIFLEELQPQARTSSDVRGASSARPAADARPAYSARRRGKVIEATALSPSRHCRRVMAGKPGQASLTRSSR